VFADDVMLLLIRGSSLVRGKAFLVRTAGFQIAYGCRTDVLTLNGPTPK